MAQHYEVVDESASKSKPRPHRFCPRHGHGSDLVSTVYVPAAWRFLLFLSRRIYLWGQFGVCGYISAYFPLFPHVQRHLGVCLNRRPGCNHKGCDALNPNLSSSTIPLHAVGAIATIAATDPMVHFDGSAGRTTLPIPGTERSTLGEHFEALQPPEGPGHVGRMQKLILTHNDMDGAEVRRIFDLAEAHGCTLSRLPRVTQLQTGLDEKIEAQPIAVEDLLGRPQTKLDREAMGVLIAGQNVLVTGAGGSIGSELVRQIAGFLPASITLLDSSEFNLYEIDQELERANPKLPRYAVLGDVRDRTRLDQLFESHAPTLVFHAAALKHVPMVEQNPLEGILTNVIGSRNVADACLTHKVQTMVLISTDKAVNPPNVMGATKRLAESYCQALDIEAQKEIGTRFVTVRFGNVLGSTGSVVPLFQKQLASGGPLTVTHAEVTRYFMTTREAVELVLQASAAGRSNNEDVGRINVLEMGKPVRIFELAEQMIRLAGMQPEKDIEIRITGLRPGEKLHEELLHESEELLPTGSAGILLAAPRTSDISTLREALDKLEIAARNRQRDEAMQILCTIVPEYTGPATTSAAIV